MNWMRRKLRVDRAREGVGERRLSDAGNVLEQQVAAGDQRLDRAPHDLGLAAQRALDVGAEPVRVAGGLIERERRVVPAAHGGFFGALFRLA